MGHSHAHFYGQCWPSVTEITNSKPKPWLQAWKDKHGAKADKKIACSNLVGQEFHRCIEQVIQGQLCQSNCRRVLKMVDTFIRDWKDLPKLKVIATEAKVWSEKYKYQGTLDCIGLLGKKLVIIDWKTSNAIYEDMGLQLVAYAKAYEEMTECKHKIKTGWIILVSKKKPHHKLVTKEFKLTKRLFNKFIKMRMNMPEQVCTESDVIDLP